MHNVKENRVAGVCLMMSLALALPTGASAENVSSLSVTGSADFARAGTAEQPQSLWLELEDYKRLEPAPDPGPRNLLVRLRESFSLDVPINDRTQVHLDWFVRHPDYLDRVFTRAQRYMPYIVSQLEERGLPLELALLPIVESAYDPFAYSHGRAAGLWQIIPGTATRFGVRQNWWYDGRRDVVDSTAAALSYLDYLHGLMDGDWLLAIASYNSGEGNVLRSVKRNRAKSLPTDFWNLTLPRETSSYVPKLLALVELVRDPQAFGLELPEVVDAPQFAREDVGGQIDLALAAELAGIEMDTLYAFNSGFNHWATDPKGPHRLSVPVDSADGFREALAALSPDQRLRWTRHKVKSGETLSGIAATHKTTVASIRNANGIKGNTIRAGAYLTIPVATRPAADYSQSAELRLARKQDQPRAGRRIEHKVRSGESFWVIGQRYGVGVRELAGWNGMAPRDTLSVGQTLVVWTKDAAAAPVTSSRTRKLNYTVRRGDSLYLIASRFRITVADLVRWNSIDRDKILRPGQTLTMYVDVTRQSG